MHRVALVLLNGQRVGTLTQQGDSYSFAYDDQYTGPGISLSFPIRSQPFESKGQLHPFFAGLAPEGWLSAMHERRNQIDAKDKFGMLMANGEDLLGAVQIRRA